MTYTNTNILLTFFSDTNEFFNKLKLIQLRSKKQIEKSY